MLAWLAVLAVVAAGLILAGEAGASASGGVGTAATAPDGGGGSNATSERVGARYERIWDRLPATDIRWARQTSECESGGNPNAIGGGGAYRGAFQFMRSTWKNSPKSPGGDPIAYPYRTQAVVAVLLMQREGADHWPVCG